MIKNILTKNFIINYILLILCALSCKNQNNNKFMEKSFIEDVNFLKQYQPTHILSNSDNQAQIVIVGNYQARVMTSTANGNNGYSFGWINYKLIESSEKQPQIHVFGGEDRFWIGPEGGQYSIFFKNGDSFDFKNWKTPALIDTEPFNLIAHSKKYAKFTKNASLINYSNTKFNFTINRNIEIFENIEIEKILSIKLNNKINVVGYQTENILINSDSTTWSKKQGLLSVWILGMYKPSAETTIIIPFKHQNNAKELIKDDYFGKIPSERLEIKDSVLLLKGDGKNRGKIGIPPSITKTFLGSYDAANQVLTIVSFNFSNDKDYVNSSWEIQNEPFKGDVVNAYNDGPLEDGSQLGPFYELETSSSAKELMPNEAITHIHQTFHFKGDFNELNSIANKVFGVDLGMMKKTNN
jgi:hypothetical protein